MWFKHSASIKRCKSVAIPPESPTARRLRALLGRISVGHTLQMKKCPTRTLSRIRSLAGWCGTLWQINQSDQAKDDFVRMNLIRITQLLARGIGQFYAAIYVLAGIDLEGLEFHYDVERIDSTYIVGEVGADAE